MTRIHSLVAVAVLAIAAAPAARADDKHASIADLKALVSQSAFQEAVRHLGDIPAAQRGADWVDVAAAACGGFLATVPTDGVGPLVAIDQIDREYPQLLKSPKYLKPRADLGVKAIDACLQNGYDAPACVDAAQRFAANSGGDRDLVIKVAKAVRRGTNGSPAVALFKRALDGAKDHAALCRDDDLQRALVAGLDEAPDSAGASDAKAVLTTCWDQVKDPIAAEFDKASAGGAFHQNTCPTLVAKNLLSPLQAKQCARK